MLIRFSRFLFWLAAVSAAAALAAADRVGTWLTALAGIALIGSFGCWRAAAAIRRADAVADDETIDMVRLDETGVLEAATRLGRAIADAEALDAALLAALEVLRSELGSREASAHRVLSLEPPIARLVTLIDGGAAGRGIEHRVRLDREPLGVALRDARVAGRDAGPYAVPVLHEGRPVALLELGTIALDVDPAALTALFDLAALQLAEVARRAADTSTAIEAYQAVADVTSSRTEVAPATPTVDSPVPVVEDNSPGRAVVGPASRRLDSRPEPAFRPDPLHDMLLRPSSPTAAPLPPQDAPGAGAAPASGTVLDAAALDKLRELDPKGDNQLIERVMKAFETSVARLLPQLQEAHRQGDQAGIRHVVHTLKASSASIGALVLSQQCADIEARIRQGEADGLEARIEAVYGELENVLKALGPWTHGKA